MPRKSRQLLDIFFGKPENPQSPSPALSHGQVEEESGASNKVEEESSASNKVEEESSASNKVEEESGAVVEITSNNSSSEEDEPPSPSPGPSRSEASEVRGRTWGAASHSLDEACLREFGCYLQSRMGEKKSDRQMKESVDLAKFLFFANPEVCDINHTLPKTHKTVHC